MRTTQIEKKLLECGVQGGTWVDAGSGNGTYTFPLSRLVSKVIALDNNQNNLSYLNGKISSDSNIETKLFDFNEPSWYSTTVDGILFGFSLHYDPIHIKALRNAHLQLKKSGKLVVFEYSSEKPVPWVPYPIPPTKLISICRKLDFQNIRLVESTSARRMSDNWNNASYILAAEK
jgi:ubiquinone/menaquinone biosynthesis C-methylase UbiE